MQLYTFIAFMIFLHSAHCMCALLGPCFKTGPTSRILTHFHTFGHPTFTLSVSGEYFVFGGRFHRYSPCTTKHGYSPYKFNRHLKKCLLSTLVNSYRSFNIIYLVSFAIQKSRNLSSLYYYRIYFGLLPCSFATTKGILVSFFSSLYSYA